MYLVLAFARRAAKGGSSPAVLQSPPPGFVFLTSHTDILKDTIFALSLQFHLIATLHSWTEEKPCAVGYSIRTTLEPSNVCYELEWFRLALTDSGRFL